MLFEVPSEPVILPATQIPSSGAAAILSHLPVAKRVDDILRSVDRNDVVFVSGATGCGKSIGVALTLMLNGYRVVCTEPRRLIASSLTDYASYLLAEEPGTKVGVLTALERRHQGDRSLITYCTDGYYLAGLLAGDPLTADVLVLDEVHEWNKNLEYILALWLTERERGGYVPKLVIESATLHAEEMVKDFSQNMAAGHIEIEGQMFPVKRNWLKSGDYVSEVLRRTKDGKEVLVRLDGKQEIYSLKEKLEKSRADIEIIPLHRELSRADQQKCFSAYDRPKVILATTIARSGITPDVDVVITNGLERRSNVVEGIQRLELVHSSQDGLVQDWGRVGRLKEGEADLISPVSFEQRPRSDVPEIQRTRYEQDILRLLGARYQLERLPLRHKYKKELFATAMKNLHAFGCVTDGHFPKVTEKGEECKRLPAQFELGILIREAEKFGIKDLAMVCAAVVEAGGLALREKGQADQYAKWRNLCFTETTMDPLAHLQLFIEAQKIRVEAGDDNELFETMMKENGLDPVRYQWATESLEMISKGESRIEIPASLPAGEVRGNLKICFIRAFKAHAYVLSPDGFLWNPTDGHRELASSSVLDLEKVKNPVVLGIPFTVEGRSGNEHKLVQMAVVAPYQQVKAEIPEFKLQSAPKRAPLSSHVGTRRR